MGKLSYKMDRLPYLSDPTLVPRVQKYLESNVDKKYVDINVMADDLQRNYREYARLKRTPFRNSVKKAYSIVLQSYGLEDHEHTSSEDEEVSDNSDLTVPLNNQYIDISCRPVPPPTKQIDENELIDISSDDSEATVQDTNNEKFNNNNNHPSTSSSSQNPYQNNTHSVTITSLNKNIGKLENKNNRKRKVDMAGLTPIQSQQQKKKKSLSTLKEPSVTLKDVGGIDKIITDVLNLLIHIRYHEAYKCLKICPPRGFLLHGPPGCGKTLLANAIAGEMSVPLLQVSAPELVGGISGESEERIRELFERAVDSTPCVLFIDEIDAITQNRQNTQRGMERRIVAQLLSCLDDLRQNENGNKVIVIGATNRPDALDPAFRRAGRFDREIRLGIPDLQARIQILKTLTSKHPIADDVDYENLAKQTPGFVGADLMQLTNEAAMEAVNRVLEAHKERLKFEEALAAQKAADEKKNMKHENSVINDNDIGKKEQDIVVDDEATSTAASTTSKVTQSNETNPDNQPIVVIDDDSKQINENGVQSTTNIDDDVDNNQNKNVIENLQEQEPMPVDLIKPTTQLEDLFWWFHHCTPLSDNELNSLRVTMDDFLKAIKSVQPSVKREGFATVPDVTWDDIGSLTDIREELQLSILAPVRHPELAKKMNLQTASGVLLCGPPGCGKTLLAKAIANEAGINFLSVKGPELLNMYLGESERAVRLCFERARNSAPCVIFFDELDALCARRSESKEEGTSNRIVNQMLTEMDGVEGRQGVFVLAASNRPDIIDPAVLRPGRLDKIIFVGLPTASDRVEILRALTKNGTQPPLAADVDLEAIGSSIECRHFTGADLAALVKEAVKFAFKEAILCGDSVLVNTEHFKRAFGKIKASIPEKDLKHYEKLRKLYSCSTEEEVEEMEYS